LGRSRFLWTLDRKELNSVREHDDDERRSEELPERWSAQRKTEIVLRVIRGEAIDEVAREIQVPVHEVEEWRRVFLEEVTSIGV
jgi:transposase-like protein